MGSSHGEFVKYLRTPHLFGSKGTDDDKHLGEAESHRFLADGPVTDNALVNLKTSLPEAEPDMTDRAR
jgi:hypothetical protein